jgi:hypothetical protein
MLSEIDHALALIGTAHWIGRFKTASILLKKSSAPRRMQQSNHWGRILESNVRGRCPP